MRHRMIFTVAVSAAFTGLMATAPAASAEPNPPGCDKGYFCAYAGASLNGQVTLRTAGDWTGRIAFRSAFNNGVAFPGADHVSLTFENVGNGSTCLHYNPGPGAYKLVADFPGAYITKVVWRGEC